MTAAIAKRFTNNCEPRFAQPFTKISAQLFSSDTESVPANVVFLIHFPPRIEDRAGRAFFQQAQKVVDRFGGHV